MIEGSVLEDGVGNGSVSKDIVGEVEPLKDSMTEGVC